MNLVKLKNRLRNNGNPAYQAGYARALFDNKIISQKVWVTFLCDLAKMVQPGRKFSVEYDPDALRNPDRSVTGLLKRRGIKFSKTKKDGMSQITAKCWDKNRTFYFEPKYNSMVAAAMKKLSRMYGRPTLFRGGEA